MQIATWLVTALCPLTMAMTCVPYACDGNIFKIYNIQHINYHAFYLIVADPCPFGFTYNSCLDSCYKVDK